MKYCIDNKEADKIVSNVVENCESLDSVYDYFDALETESLSEKDFSAIFDGLYKVISQEKEKAYMLYALFAHHKIRPHYALKDSEVATISGVDLCSFPSDKRFMFQYGEKWEIIVQGFLSPEKELEIMQKFSHSVERKLCFINKLLKISKDLFVEQDEDGNEYIVENKNKHSFLNIITYGNNVQIKREDNWDIADIKFGRKFMLFYGNHNLVEVSEFNNHSNPVVSTSLSLILPIFSDGFDFCRPGIGKYDSICYMEAR